MSQSQTTAPSVMALLDAAARLSPSDPEDKRISVALALAARAADIRRIIGRAEACLDGVHDAMPGPALRGQLREIRTWMHT